MSGIERPSGRDPAIERVGRILALRGAGSGKRIKDNAKPKASVATARRRRLCGPLGRLRSTPFLFQRCEAPPALFLCDVTGICPEGQHNAYGEFG